QRRRLSAQLSTSELHAAPAGTDCLSHIRSMASALSCSNRCNRRASSHPTAALPDAATHSVREQLAATSSAPTAAPVSPDMTYRAAQQLLLELAPFNASPRVTAGGGVPQ